MNKLLKTNQLFRSFLLLGAFILMCGVGSIYAQNPIRITGKVSDSNGEPLPFVTVMVKGQSQTGASTADDGTYTINVPNANSVLQFSFVGFVTKEVPVGTNTILNVTLEAEASVLDQVVVVGFGTQKRVNVTGSVSTINSQVIENRPVTNVGQALQGVIPGLNLSVNNSGGQLNNEMNIDIRGSGTIGDGSNSAPLVLIDGVEGNMNGINPNDIATISVLKDAASASIYGSRAAFGVILITTKTGKQGRTSVNYSGNVRFSTAIAVPKMMDSYTFARYFNRAANNEGQADVFTSDIMDRIIAYQAGTLKEGTQLNPNNNLWRSYDKGNADTDWFKEQYKSGVPSHEHNLSISGGNEKVTYLASGNFLDQDGLIRHGGDNLKRYSLNARLTAKLYDFLDMNVTTKWIRTDYGRPNYMVGLFFHNIARRWPTNPVKDPNGYYTASSEIIQLRDGGRWNEQKDNQYNQLQFVLKPLEGWNIYVEGNHRITNRDRDSHILPIYEHNGDGDPVLMSYNGGANGYTYVYQESLKENFYTTNIYTDYTRDIAGHNFKVMAGFNAELMKQKSVWGSKEGLISPEVPNLNTATQNPKSGGGNAEWATAGFFGRLNYNYKERYLFEFNIRYDGTSRFIGDKRWGTFPSFSGGWNIAKENFFGDLSSYISTLKVRGSWGQLGNMNTSSWYPFFPSMSLGTQNGNWLVDSGSKPNTSNAAGLVSALMTWETVQSWNIGLDWAAFRNRLTGSFDVFRRDTKDMIGPAPQLPGILGTSVPKVNNADMKTTGFELEIGWKDKIQDFTYGVKFVLSDNQSTITRYPNETGSISTHRKGKKLNEIWGYETIGIAKTDAEMNTHLATTSQSSMGSSWAAGDIMYRDLDGNNEINSGSSTISDPGDRRIIGNSTPRYKYGVTLDFAWKGIDLNVFFQGIGKRDYMLTGPYFWGAYSGMWQSAGFDEHWDFFRPEGDPLGANVNSYYPRPIFSDGNGSKNRQTQTKYLQDASYLRLKNIQLGYTLPVKWVSAVGLQYVRVYMSAENLFTISDISGIFDPETIGSAYDSNSGKTYPLQRVISFGINVNF